MNRHIDLLEGLAAGNARDVLALASPLTLPPGEVLFHLGSAATSLYVVESGLVVLTMPMQIGGHDQDVLIDERVPGQTLGWSTLIPPHRFTLKAAVPVETQLLVLPREQLLAFCAARPDVGYRVSQNVAMLVGQRLQVFQAMWLRQMQHLVNHVHA